MVFFPPLYLPLSFLSLQITSTLTFAAACASAGITVLIGNDLNDCAQNHCTRFETATAMAFMSWFAVSPSFLLDTGIQMKDMQFYSVFWHDLCGLIHQALREIL